jgi:hypothetical protein
LTIDIGSVATRNLDTFNEKLTTSLKRIAANGIDTQRMFMVINREERQVYPDFYFAFELQMLDDLMRFE